MAKRPFPGTNRGFSMVEMLVALLFVGILMAGMAGVFKSSIGTFYTTGEKLSSMRRNRASIDLLYDDLNSAGMFLGDLVNPPQNLSANNPPFYILPNQPIANPAADGPQTADELYFYFDQPLAFEGQLVISPTAPQRTASELVALGLAPDPVQDSTFTIECNNAAYAASVATGQCIVFKDFYESLYITSVKVVNDTQVTVTTGANSANAVTGNGSTGTPEKAAHINGSNVVFYTPAQMVRYSIQMKFLDPANPVGVPCLVRDQNTYAPGGFTASAPQQIITENVSNFKVYLSANSGQSWAGLDLPATTSGFANGWTGGIQAELNTQLLTAGRVGYTTTAGNLTWFRSIPALVRIDLTTRTATKRSEYSSTPTTSAAYNQLTQSLVLVPRHFGLAMN